MFAFGRFDFISEIFGHRKRALKSSTIRAEKDVLPNVNVVLVGVSPRAVGSVRAVAHAFVTRIATFREAKAVSVKLF